MAAAVMEAAEVMVVTRIWHDSSSGLVAITNIDTPEVR